MKQATQIKKDIAKAQVALIKKAKKRGLWENFGQNEVRELRDKHDYPSMIYGSMEQRQMVKPIEDFNQWCMNVGIDEIKCAKV